MKAAHHEDGMKINNIKHGTIQYKSTVVKPANSYVYLCVLEQFSTAPYPADPTSTQAEVAGAVAGRRSRLLAWM